MKIIKYFKDIYDLYRMPKLLLTTAFITLMTVVVDYFDVLTHIYMSIGIPVIICIALFIVIKLLSLKPLALLFVRSVNYIDFYNISLFSSIIWYILIIKLFNDIIEANYYKIKISLAILIISTVIMIMRYLYITIIQFKNRKAQLNVFDLKQLYEDKIPKDIEFLLIDDDAVDYDLLERSKVINQIKTTIINCKTNSKFVMSLKGEWGSGKTTILNIVKKELKSEKLLFIDDFEPWIYTDKKSLLTAFFDKIMKNINCGFRMDEINLFTKTYLKTITSKMGYITDSFFDNNVDIDRIKKIINNYLESNDKRIVLVLDNLERCSSENILFIMKTIHSLFNFKRIIYILSYDDKVMRDIFQSKMDFDYTYLEKMIQLEFNMPKIDRGVLKNIMTECIRNYLKHSKYKSPENEQNEIINSIIDSVQNLRDFKRIINSTFTASFDNAQDLNSVDMLLLETLALKNPELYNEIKKNSKYYISEDRYVYGDDYIYNSEKYNVSTTKYFNSLFDSDKYNIKKYEKIICYLFPNVKLYLEKQDDEKKERIEFIPENYSYGKEKEYRASVLDKRAYNNKYFNLYFNKTENEFVEINRRIKNFIELINNKTLKIGQLYEEYLNMEKVYPGWVEKYTLETFQMYLNNIKNEKLLSLLRIIYYSYYDLNDEPLFFQLNAKSRSQVIMADIIIMLSDVDYKEFIQEIKGHYNNLYLIREIAYWLEPKNRHNELISEDRYKDINSLYEKMLNEIKNKNINMYNFKKYNRYNMVMLFNDKKYMEYIRNRINRQNLMLFVLDTIHISSSSNGIGYVFDKERIEEYYGWERFKTNIMKCPESKLKEFLIKALESMKKRKTASIEDKYTYYVENWIDLDSLIKDYLKKTNN